MDTLAQNGYLTVVNNKYKSNTTIFTTPSVLSSLASLNLDPESGNKV